MLNQDKNTPFAMYMDNEKLVGQHELGNDSASVQQSRGKAFKEKYKKKICRCCFKYGKKKI